MAVRMSRQHSPKQFLSADSHAWEHPQRWTPQTLRPHLSVRRQPGPQIYPHLHRLRQTPETNSPPNCSKALLTPSTPSLSAASKQRTNGGSTDSLLSTTPSSIYKAPSSATSSGSTNGDVFLTSLSSSVEFNFSNNEWRG